MRTLSIMFLLTILLVICIIGIVSCSNNSFTQNTPEPVPQNTPEPKLTYEQITTMAKKVSYDELLRNNEKYVGKIVKITGEIFYIENYKGKLIYQIHTHPVLVEGMGTRYNIDDMVLIDGNSEEKLLERDIVLAYGTVVPLLTYNTNIGEQKTVPALNVQYLKIIRKAGDL